MDRLKFDDFASDFDDLLMDVDELQDQSTGPDDRSLDGISPAQDGGHEEVDDSIDFELET